ncbi:glycosyltransferase [Aquabacterium sp.]|uniref:glycosyltransferase n=1 Tax=Aquabacterium sp. TaxID=1872578 RepID=UPI0027BA3B3C|nr:glycosyltransferase [Aquabacterium sp.]
MPEAMTGKMKFDQRLREALVEMLAPAHTVDLTQTLTEQDRQALKAHARVLGWQAPIALISTHEAAEMAVAGDVQAFESMVTLAQICYQRATLPDFSSLHDAMQSSVLHHKVMAAVETMAAAMPQGKGLGSTKETGRLAFVLSSLISGSGTTYVIRALIPELVAKGWEIVVYSTLLLDSTDQEVAQELHAMGVPVHRPPAQPQQLVLAGWIADHLRENPVDVVVHYVWPNDFVSKLLSNLRCAPVQVFVNHTCDQPTGNFDLKIGYSGDYKGHHQPDMYVTFPNCSVRGSQARRAEPFDRTPWGLPGNTLLLATFSRLAKCVDEPFLRAMCSVLRANPTAAWLLVGERDASSEAQINAHLSRAGVQDQVTYLGFMYHDDYFRLLKTVDIYCDTITWMGGQTVADAVVCGLPVVCCAPSPSAALAPHGNNSTVLASSLLAPGSLIAQAGGGEDYARIVQAYIDDPALRAHAGAINAQSATDDAWHAYVKKFDVEIRRVLLLKLASAVPAQGADRGHAELEARTG